MAVSSKWNVWLYLQLIYNILQVFAFNLDTDVPIIKVGIADSYFGFSVAQHQVSNEGSGKVEPGFIVGAPKDYIRDPEAPQDALKLERPGVVYHCPLSPSRDDCRALQIDWFELEEDDNKNNQWMGVSVQSQGTTTGKAMACAHRYKISGRTYTWGLGVCYSLTNALDEDDYFVPCAAKPVDTGHSQYGFCQAGTSLAVDKEGDILVGAPGPFDWRGAVFKNVIRSSLSEFPKWYQSPLVNPVVESYSYLGMSSAIGKLINRQLTYVGGAPRAGNGLGQVLLFTAGDDTDDLLRIRPEHYLTGDQFGACFGYSLAVSDFNNDNIDDLAVGAPFHQGTRIGGAVYVYLNSGNGITSSTPNITILSRTMNTTECEQLNCNQARFGFSLAAIGDLDLDGYNDLAVGAPYEGDGVVYIYRGSAHGPGPEFSQRIPASALTGAPAASLTTFGYSLSGGMDMDDNDYPDLVVGAFSGAAVAVLRSRPVINVEARMEVPESLDPKVTQCEETGVAANCFNVRVCFKYTAASDKSASGRLNLNYKIEAEKFDGRKLSRVSFKGSTEGHEISRNVKLTQQGVGRCKTQLVYLSRTNRDFLHAIPLRLTYKLQDVDPPTMDSRDSRYPDLGDYPVLHAQEVLKQVQFQKNCGADQTCSSELQVNGKLPQLDRDPNGDYILKVGQDSEVRLEVNVRNQGEDAHQASVLVTLPSTLSYLGVLRVKGKKAYVCTPHGSNVTCSIGNPMPANQRATFIIRLTANNLVASTKKIAIGLAVNTTSSEEDDSNNKDKLIIRVAVETDLSIQGYAEEPVTVFYGGKIVGESEIRYENEIGDIVVHNYEVKNRGPGRVGNATVKVSWPYELASNYDQGKHLLYLMQAPVVKGSNALSAGRCYLDRRYVNPLKIKKEGAPPDTPANRTAKSTSRTKRETTQTAGFSFGSGSKKTVVLDCKNGQARCFKFDCVLGSLNRGESVIISMQARLWNSTFVEEFADVDKVLIHSHAKILIDPKISIKQTNVKNDESEAMTEAIPDIQVQKKPGVPLWVIIVAAVGGVLLLIILIVILWKCGFFKRNKAKDMRTKAQKKRAIPEEM